MQLEIQLLRSSIATARERITQITPFAKLEEACIAYERKPRGAVAGAVGRKLLLESQIAVWECELEQAITMSRLVQAELGVRYGHEMSKELAEALGRLRADAETDNFVRWHRGERPVIAMGPFQPARPGPSAPTREPTKEQLATYRKLEIEVNNVRSRMGSIQTTNQLLIDHPEIKEMIEGQNSVDAEVAA